MKKILIIISLLLLAFTDLQLVNTKASFYHNRFQNKRMANGERFSQKELTCAYNKYPLGSVVRVVNIENDSSVLVEITDRTSKSNKRIDLSKKAFKQLGELKEGLLKVKIELL
jgi:rare lipoprotein A